MTLYQNGTLVWGTEPRARYGSPSPAEPLTLTLYPPRRFAGRGDRNAYAARIT